MKRTYLKELFKDLCILAVGIAVAFALVKLGYVERFLTVTDGMYILASFAAGMLFTSVVTVAPASVALVALSTRLPAIDVAFWGACGAMIVDYLIFTFIRTSVSREIFAALKRPLRRQLISLFHFGFMRWGVAMLGALIVASPLPDELGVALLGFSRVKTHHFVVLTFTMNFIGILALAGAASAVL